METKAMPKKDRKNEKGAAMIMVILMSFLLLIASAGLLLETTMSTANVTDAVAEQQAYYAAESGIQSALNVLRDNCRKGLTVCPSTEEFDFGKAVKAGSANADNDTSGVPRLSRWIDYNYKPNGLNGTALVKLGAGDYTPRSGYAYSLNVIDPDKTGQIISFKTNGYFYDPRTATRGWKDNSITFGTSPNTVEIKYSPTSESNLDVSSGNADTDFGTFTVTRSGTGAAIPDVRFEILETLTAPYNAERSIRGWIKATTVLNTTASLNFEFDTQEFEVMGSVSVLDSKTLTVLVGGSTDVTGTISPAKPYRLVLHSIGYGPRGARKELEATVQKNFFNGLQAPATLTLIGGTSGFNFEAGTSQNVAYSGDDIASNILIPPIGTSNGDNLDAVNANLLNRGHKADITGTPSDVSREMPQWLRTPDNLDNLLNQMRDVASSSYPTRLFTGGLKPSDGDVGDNATATGITFVEGDFTLTGSGGGILIVTGKLTLHGNFSFNGLIIVTGEGGVDRRGGGNGLMRGNTVVAPYDPTKITPLDPTDPPAQFFGPKYDISGGGNSTIRYDSSSVDDGMRAVSSFVLGVAEK